MFVAGFEKFSIRIFTSLLSGKPVFLQIESNKEFLMIFIYALMGRLSAQLMPMRLLLLRKNSFVYNCVCFAFASRFPAMRPNIRSRVFILFCSVNEKCFYYREEFFLFISGNDFCIPAIVYLLPVLTALMILVLLACDLLLPLVRAPFYSHVFGKPSYLAFKHQYVRLVKKRSQKKRTYVSFLLVF